MAIDFRAIVSPPPQHPADRDNHLTFVPDWNDQIVTLVAMALAILIVAAIAILIGTN